MVEVLLEAVVVAVTDETPRILTVVAGDGTTSLPSGTLLETDETLELGLRRVLASGLGINVGYAEQLYSFGDLHRGPGTNRQLSIAYLCLVDAEPQGTQAEWVDLYDLLPWEDHRNVDPTNSEDETVVRRGQQWVLGNNELRAERQERLEVVFGLGPAQWDGVRVLERYELLYELGLLGESDDYGVTDLAPTPSPDDSVIMSAPMALDHRRIVATAFGRLRGKLTYRPVVFELLAAEFTLLQLQRLVEALAGVRLHKQNFRRLVENGGLVERTGHQAKTGGRPAELFEFRRDVIRERPAPGIGTPWVRT